MAWLRAGTVAVTNGSTTVTGTGTGFAANTRVGDAFIGPDGRQYELANVASDTVISITPAYQGATASGASYAIMPVQGYQKGLADQVRDWVNTYGSKMAALGTTGNYDILPVAKGGTGGTDQAGARAGLGLGNSAVRNTGTSGDNVPLLSGVNSWSAPQTLANGSVVGSPGVAPGAAVYQVMSSQGRIILTQGTALSSIQSTNAANSGYQPLNVVCTNFYNDIDNSANLGNGSKRWATVFAASGTINTSDAREKTAVSEMSQAEINAAMALAKEIGTYKWLDAVANKGDEARIHIGLTVQRAIEVMESFGLVPLNYAFVCHDEWPAIEEQGHESIRGNIYSLGERIYTNVEISTFDQYKEYPATFTWEETSREYVVTQEAAPAGDRYGFRYDQLALFIARGQEERLVQIESRLQALNI